MKTYKLDQFNRGWMFGDFENSIIRTKAFEVGVRDYVQGQISPKHYHTYIDDFIIVVSGVISLNGIEFRENDIIQIERNEVSEMQIISPKAKLVFVKTPSIPSDKTLVD